MNPRNVAIVFGKEVLDIVRDRRTLLFMVLLPIAIIPLLVLVLGKVTEAGIERLERTPSRVALLGERWAPVPVLELLRHLEDPEAAGRWLAAQLAGGAPHPFVAGLLMPDADAQPGLAGAPVGPRGGGTGEEQAGPVLERARRLRLLRVVALEVRSPVLARALAQAPAELLDPQALAPAPGGGSAAGPHAAAEPAPPAGGAEPAAAELSPALLARARQELCAEAAAAIEQGRLDAVLIFHPGFAEALERGYGARYTVLVDEAQDRSSIARNKIEALFERGARGVTRAQLVRAGLDPEVLQPVRGQVRNVGRERNLLALFLPYLVIIMCFSGALYPAIDLGAGEKERGTLETLLLTPARRSELVAGKFLVVLLAGLLAAALNVASLSLTLASGWAEARGIALVFEPLAAVLTVLLMVPTAAIFAALLLAISVYARSFREAQSYAVPLNFLVIVPAFFSMIPGFELDPILALVPVLNVTLALKEIWTGTVQAGMLALIFASTAAYAAVAILACAAWFRRESVLFRA
ncbi:MAG: hypothetical protein KatS3mg102_0326 [Planctomycetota bacterium]|nr:MAG: hypothetical protein KatS3mg102_0326 [Planctomycetota bacterium]